MGVHDGEDEDNPAKYAGANGEEALQRGQLEKGSHHLEAKLIPRMPELAQRR